MANNQRNAIKLERDEADKYLRDSRRIVLATNGHDGCPHLVAMWYVVKDGDLLMTTYGKSQKALNIKRDPRASVLAESGDQYDQLKGLMLRGRAEVIEGDVDLTADVLRMVGAKMSGVSISPGQNEVLLAQARKRVVIRFSPEKTASWDHAKMRASRPGH
jgi:PPOX class probable F420-dependent enzyme